MQLLLMTASIVLSIGPMLMALAGVWMLDRYQREPLWLFGLTFLWGALGGVFGALVGSSALLLPAELLSPEWAEILGPVVVAPLIEEPAKAAFLLFVLWHRAFDTTTDGFVYGAAAGLGFAATENLLYFWGAAGSGDPMMWAQTVVIRTFFSAVVHATASALIGAGLGWARFRGWLGALFAVPLGFLLGMSVHAMWNGLLTLDGQLGGGGEGQWAMLAFVLLPVSAALTFTSFQLCLFDESRTIRRQLEDEARDGLIPAEHPAILGSWIRRHLTGWAPPGLEHRRYVAAATTLALRKRQLALVPPQRSEFYRDDVARLRREVKRLLDNAGG